MESRTQLIVTLVSLIAISLFASAVGTYRIRVLSTDITELVEVDLPLERAAESLRDVVQQRTAAIERSTNGIDHSADGRIATLSGAVEKQLDTLDILLGVAGPRVPEFANLRGTLEVVRRREDAFRSLGEDVAASLLLAQSRDVHNATADLLAPSAGLTDRVTARTANDQRSSLGVLFWLAFSSLVLGTMLARFALRLFSEVQTLRILVPVCSNCHAIRNDPSFWRLIDRYLKDNPHTTLAHGYCSQCESGGTKVRQPPFDDTARQ